MRATRSLLAALITLAACVPSAMALDPNDAAASAAGCFGCSTCMLFIIGGTVLHILLIVWVAKDATSRRADSAILWIIVVLFFPLVGIIVYLIVRPQGLTVKCPHCGNDRLQGSPTCPHCGGV
jgi:Phospholipase_D-nuclease N-terminal